MRWLVWIACAALAGFLTTLASADETAAPKPWEFGGFIGGQADHFVDPTGTLTIDDVMGASANRFVFANGKPANRGVAKQRTAAFWLRLSLPSLGGSPPANWVVSLDEPRTRAATLYIVNSISGERKSQMWRFDQPPSPGAANTRYPVFQFRAQDLADHTIYLRIETRQSMRANLWLAPTSRFAASYAREALLFGALAGILIALTFYCIALGAAIGEASLIALAAQSFAIAAYVLGDRALVETLLIEGATTQSRLMSFSGTFLIYLTALVFSAIYLKAPLAWRWSRGLIIGLGLAFISGAVIAAIDILTDRSHLRPFSGALGIAALGSLVSMVVATGWFQPLRAALYFICCIPAIGAGLLRLSLDAFPAQLAASPFAVNAIYPGLAASMLLFAVLTSVEGRQRAMAARRALTASERRFRDYSLTASDEFWETDKQGIVTRASQRDVSALALNVGEPLLATIAARVRPSDRSGLIALEQALAAARPFRNIRINISGASLDERHVLLNGLPIVDDSDPIVAWRGAMTDITDEVIRERNRGRERTMAALGVMVGSIAHEINNLVHPIVNLSRLAMEAPALDEPYRRWLGIIHQSGQRAGEIVADVLGLSRSRAESQRAPFGQAVAEAVATLDTLGGAQLKIEARIESLTGPDVKSTLVFQILSNLVSNASRAMDHAGPVAIRYREIDAREGARLFELTVTDSGVGMNETSRRRALEPLFTATRDGEGAGLGLSIVREIVESLNGEITIESRQGFGTSVAIVTPWPIIETPLQRAGE